MGNPKDFMGNWALTQDGEARWEKENKNIFDVSFSQARLIA
jgi:hypothetical protein